MEEPVDEWEGGRESLQELWLGANIGRNEHQHISHCGGYYAHSHYHGQEPHTHTHEPCRDCKIDS